MDTTYLQRESHRFVRRKCSKGCPHCTSLGSSVRVTRFVAIIVEIIECIWTNTTQREGAGSLVLECQRLGVVVPHLMDCPVRPKIEVGALYRRVPTTRCQSLTAVQQTHDVIERELRPGGIGAVDTTKGHEVDGAEHIGRCGAVQAGVGVAVPRYPEHQLVGTHTNVKIALQTPVHSREWCVGTG